MTVDLCLLVYFISNQIDDQNQLKIFPRLVESLANITSNIDDHFQYEALVHGDNQFE